MLTDAKKSGILSALINNEVYGGENLTQDAPADVFGVDVSKLKALGDIVLDSTLLPGLNSGLRLLTPAIELLPLIQQVQAEGTVDVDSVEPYRPVIAEIKPLVGRVERIAAKFGNFAVNALDKKVASEVVTQVSKTTTEAKIRIERLEDDIKHVASFENPKEQFTVEMDRLSNEVHDAINREHARRINGTAPEEEKARGFFGFVSKVVHEVKNFFKRLFGGAKRLEEVSAYDAGAGINQVFNALKQDVIGTAEKYPLLSRFIQKKAFLSKTFNKDKLSFVAPEILNFLFSVVDKTDKDRNLIKSVERNPHALRFVTDYVKNFRGYSVEGIQKASHNLIPAFINLLPTSGDAVMDTYNQIHSLVSGGQASHLDLASKTIRTRVTTGLSRTKASYDNVKEKLKKKKNKS